ncbi:hypothetical protein CG723_43765 [Streptomyces sp. CB01635]|nr:hypothetical protein CG723_43765 [Streptomyces sp. CB01635]
MRGTDTAFGPAAVAVLALGHQQLSEETRIATQGQAPLPQSLLCRYARTVMTAVSFLTATGAVLSVARQTSRRTTFVGVLNRARLRKAAG